MNSSSVDVLIHDWDIGKLINSNVKLNNLSREEIYGILTCELPMTTFVFPRTRLSESGWPILLGPSDWHVTLGFSLLLYLLYQCKVCVYMHTI